MGAGSWIARVLLATVFLAAAALKLSARPGAVAVFDALGLGQALRVLVGLAEGLGALGLLVTPLATPAALGLALVMAGAVAAHLLVLGPGVLPAVVCLLLCLFVAWQERSAFAGLRLLSSGKGPMDGWIARQYDRGVQAAFRDLIPELSADVLPAFATATRVLDVGCGPGQFTVYFAEQVPGAEVWGVDLAPTMIELARGHARESAAADRLHFDVADVAALSFADGFFDAVVSTGSIKHWPDPVAGLREIHRVVRAGGRVVVAEMNRLASAAAIAAQRPRLRHWFFRLIYPRVFAKGLSPDEAQRVFGASPLGPPARVRMLLDGCFWVFETSKAPAQPSP
jgi:ubiquinone/menaquinone biosynthesis C-methylase UbiE